jgi:hypothetical protein
VCQKLKEKYDFVTYSIRKEHGGIFDNLSDVTEAAVGAYIWWFGDDDLLMPGGLNYILDCLQKNSVSFICAGYATLKPHTGKIISGTVIELCNLLGWNQVIGWISGDILSADLAKKVFHLLREEPYKLDAYAHVGAILTVAANSKALYVDYPICAPMGNQEKIDLERWDKENIGWRYFLLIDTFKYMFENKILTKKFNPKFFQYLNYYIWDRFIVNMISSELNGHKFPEKGWNIILLLSEMVDDVDMRKNIRTRSESVRMLCNDRKNLIESLKVNEKRLIGLAKETSNPVLVFRNLTDYK